MESKSKPAKVNMNKSNKNSNFGGNKFGGPKGPAKGGRINIPRRTP